MLVGSLAHSISVSCVRVVKFVNDQLGHQQQDMTYNLHKSALQLIEKVWYLAFINELMFSVLQPARCVQEIVLIEPRTDVTCFEILN